MRARTRTPSALTVLAWSLTLMLPVAGRAAAQPPVELALLTAPNPVASSAFGLSVAIDGDRLVALRRVPGAGPEHDVEAFIYERSGASSDWDLEKQVLVGQMQTWEPIPVTLDGDRMVVGIQIDPNLGGAIGGIASVFIHERNAGGPDAWGQVERLGTEEPFDNYGVAVDLEGDLLIVGSLEAIFPRPETAFVYRRDADTGDWEEIATLRPEDGLLGGQFSRHVVLSGDTALVARGRLGLAQALIFEPDPTGEWRQVAVLDVSAQNASFIPTIGLDGDRAVVQVFVPGIGSGIAVFERDHGGLNQWGRVATTYLPPGLSLGSSMALSGDSVVAGAAFADTAYHFERSGAGPNGWPLAAAFQPSAPPAFATFGDAIGLDGDTLVVGAPGTQGSVGSAYVFSTQLLFGDGFETGGTARWSSTVP